MLSAPDDPGWAAAALRAGVRGILPKSATGEQLVRAIHDVHDGSMWAPRRVMAACIGLLPESVPPKPVTDPSLDNRLSERERQIFRNAATGPEARRLGPGELAAVYYGILPDRSKF
jgi:DNA-binding NarL/FixJ family response regulator